MLTFIRFTVVDVMYNLLLGTGKHMLNIWVDENILTKKMLTDIEQKIAAFRVPGKLPSRIGSLHGSFTGAIGSLYIPLLY